MTVLEELERALWDEKNWDLSLLSKNPVESYREFVDRMDRGPDTPIDDLPNKDWLRAK